MGCKIEDILANIYRYIDSRGPIYPYGAAGPEHALTVPVDLSQPSLMGRSLWDWQPVQGVYYCLAASLFSALVGWMISALPVFCSGGGWQVRLVVRNPHWIGGTEPALMVPVRLVNNLSHQGGPCGTVVFLCMGHTSGK